MRIYVALVSLGRVLQRVPLREVPAYVTERGFDGFEILDRQLTAAPTDELRDVARRCRAHSCGVIVDANCDLTRTAGEQRRAERAHLEAVIDQARVLDCGVVRVTLGGQVVSVQKLFRKLLSGTARVGQGRSLIKGVLSSAWIRRYAYAFRSATANLVRLDPDKLERAVQMLDEVLPYAGRAGVALAIENHWGISSRPEWILDAIEAVKGPNIGSCPDFGNFPSAMDRYAALARLAPRALHVQAKCWRFRADGEETTIDFGRCMRILREAGYDGAVAIEYEGGGDGPAACEKARDLILRHLSPTR